MKLLWFRHKKDNKQDSETTLDLRGSTPETSFGKPQPCPECGGAGFLDRIDVRNRIQHQHCSRCGAVYVTTEAELGLKKFDTGAAIAGAVSVENNDSVD
jgi:hypothetical protein